MRSRARSRQLRISRVATRPMCRTVVLFGAALLSIMPSGSGALTTVCSDPSRARVLASTVVRLPTDNIDALERRFDVLAPSLGMTTWGVTSSKGNRVEQKTLGLQSPEVSVSIEAHWRPGQRAATVEVSRTCINDALEPWRSYWAGLVSGLRRAGYTVA